MRKILLLTALSVSLLISCSTEEQVTEAEINRFDSVDIGKALAEGLGNADFNLSHLFDYATIEEAQKATHKAIEEITHDAREELAKGPTVTGHS